MDASFDQARGQLKGRGTDQGEKYPFRTGGKKKRVEPLLCRGGIIVYSLGKKQGADVEEKGRGGVEGTLKGVKSRGEADLSKKEERYLFSPADIVIGGGEGEGGHVDTNQF